MFILYDGTCKQQTSVQCSPAVAERRLNVDCGSFCSLESLPLLGLGGCPLEAFGRGETLQLKCKDVGRVCNDIISGKRTHSNGPFLRMVQQLAPPCVGDGFFRIEDCTRGGAPDNQVMRRFQEYMPSGFCISCQQRYMEQRGF